jgi:peptidyl-prolyl cis-trans isomerase D
LLQTLRSSAKYIFWFILLAFIVGFLLLETSGLIGANQITASTPVASVNGVDIPYQAWLANYQAAVDGETQRQGRALTLDEIEKIKEQSLNQMISEVLLEQEYNRRGIEVTDDEIRQAATYMPPQQLMQSPELQTEGQFDPEKYQRLLRSPTARQSGLLVNLENYYRTELPKQKLFEQIASDVYVTDSRLWGIWQDSHDSARVSYVALRPETVTDSVPVSDEEVRAYFEKHRKQFERPGRAAVSLITLPRAVTPFDSAAVRTRILQLRSEIVSGARKFEDVAKEASADSASAVAGGSLGRGARGRFVPDFENAAYALKPGEVSQPVLTQFGYHLIKVDSRKGDTIDIRHILLRIQQSDSTAVAVDRRADSLLAAVGGDAKGARFDSAAKRFGLPVVRLVAFEGEPLQQGVKYIPSVSAWAFTAQPGEISDLLDAEDAYYLARLDTLVPGGEPKLETVKADVRRAVQREKKVDKLIPRAKEIADAAARGTLESAAVAKGASFAQTPLFNRVSFVPGLGQFSEVIGAAFTLPVGSVSAPIKTRTGVYVIRVDERRNASRTEWEAQKDQQRQQLLQGLRQQRVQVYIDNLRKSAKIEDRRKEFEAAARLPVEET